MSDPTRPRRATPPATLLRGILVLSLAPGIFNVALASGLDSARQRGKLLAGVHYVVPPYKAGTKFRTPEAPDSALLEDLGKRLKLTPEMTFSAHSGVMQQFASGKLDLALVRVAEDDTLRRKATVIPTGYAAGAMAIMRTDTDIKAWEQLKGRKVCVSEGSAHAGTLAAKYGAVEKLYRAAADALIAVRVGDCDAAVHDSTMLEELIKYPEWKKFSANLPPRSRQALSFVVPAHDRKSAAFLRDAVRDWASAGFLDKHIKNATRNIAFEVYLDQNVPDCH